MRAIWVKMSALWPPDFSLLSRMASSCEDSRLHVCLCMLSAEGCAALRPPTAKLTAAAAPYFQAVAMIRWSALLLTPALQPVRTRSAGSGCTEQLLLGGIRPVLSRVVRRVWGTRLELAAVELDEAAVREEDLLPHKRGAQRLRARKPLPLHRRTRGPLLRRGRGIRPAAPDLRRRSPALQPEPDMSSALELEWLAMTDRRLAPPDRRRTAGQAWNSPPLHVRRLASSPQPHVGGLAQPARGQAMPHRAAQSGEEPCMWHPTQHLCLLCSTWAVTV